MVPKTDKADAKSEWLVYILKCRDGSHYTGITNDLARRLKAHNEGTASKYTRSKRPVKVVFRETLRTKSQALRRELEIKKLSRDQKVLLIKARPKK